MDWQLTRKEIKAYNKKRPRKARKSICHAPARSLYFGKRGEIMVCCTNRSHLAGRYPEMSIRECWESAQVMKIREALKTGDMSNGCQICYHIVRSGNYQNMMGRIYDRIPANRNGYPTRFDFELTNTCNLECVMCRGELSSSIRRNRDQLPAIPSPYDDAFLRQLEEFIPHLSESYFAGGEPFLIKQYLEIWDRMAVLNPGHHLSVQTNATILTDRIRKILDKLPMSIAVSIDSVQAERLESIRVNAKWDTVLGHIHEFKAYCDRVGTQLTISYTPMTLNWMELPDAIEFCNRLGIDIYFNHLSYPRHLAFNSLKAKKLREISAFLHRYDPPAQWLANRKSYLDLVAQIDYWLREAEEKERAGVTPTGLRDDQWFDALERYLHKEHGAGKADALFHEIEGSILGILESLPGDSSRDRLWEHLGTVGFPSMVAFVPGKSQAELQAALRTAVQL